MVCTTHHSDVEYKYSAMFITLGRRTSSHCNFSVQGFLITGIMNLVLFFMSMLLAVGYSVTNKNYNAAVCCSKGVNCSVKYARLSVTCVRGKRMAEQAKECQMDACAHCAESMRRLEGVCRTAVLRQKCMGLPPLVMLRKMRETPKTPGKKLCSFGPVWNGGGKIVVGFSDMKVKGNWSENPDGSRTWKKGGGKGIDKKGVGAICVPFKPAISGNYYFTAMTSAPHPHDHNDAWFKFSTSVKLYRPHSETILGGKANTWYKGFQNEGKGVQAKYILTVDNNGHQFVLPSLRKNKRYWMCVSGRSTRFVLRKLVLIKCQGNAVTGCNRFSPFMTQALRALPPSKCTA